MSGGGDHGLLVIVRATRLSLTCAAGMDGYVSQANQRSTVGKEIGSVMEEGDKKGTVNRPAFHEEDALR